MGYAQYLRDLLRPLGVYDLSAGSFSGGELEALGAALDALWIIEQQNQRESVPATAEDEGLRRWESLFSHRAPAETPDARRNAIGGFLSIGGDSFTVDALRRCLAACGVACRLEETDTRGTVAVSFPGIMGRPAGYEAVRGIIEDILPCHLAVAYHLRWCAWGEAAGLRWSDVNGWTWMELQTYRA